MTWVTENLHRRQLVMYNRSCGSFVFRDEREEPSAVVPSLAKNQSNLTQQYR